MIRPNFFILGAPKSGTTALNEYLSDHPNIFSPYKELSYFDFDLFYPLKMDLETYLALFDGADPEAHKSIGDATVSYLFSDCAVKEILKFNPEAKFIVLLRNPVDLVQSLHSQKVANGHENLLDFEEAWRAETDRKKGQRIPFSCWEPRLLLYSEWAKLGAQMERLFSSVSRDRVKVILFDDFVADTRKVYEEALSFLGLPSNGRTEFPRINENKRVLCPRLQATLTIVHIWAETVKKALGLKSGLGLLTKLSNMNQTITERKPISIHFQNELKTFFREDVAKLSKILGRDLSRWCATGTAASEPLRAR